MLAQVFRILNLCWAALMAAVILMLWFLALPDPPLPLTAGVGFWMFYLLVAFGTFLDMRVAWVLCILHLLAIWLLMGLAVSEKSFLFLTGQEIGENSGYSAAVVVFNSFFGVLVPASGLIVLLLLSRDHITSRLRETGDRPDRPRRRRA